jgi:hypothetical protein
VVHPFAAQRLSRHRAGRKFTWKAQQYFVRSTASCKPSQNGIRFAGYFPASSSRSTSTAPDFCLSPYFPDDTCQWQNDRAQGHRRFDRRTESLSNCSSVINATGPPCLLSWQTAGLFEALPCVVTRPGLPASLRLFRAISAREAEMRGTPRIHRAGRDGDQGVKDPRDPEPVFLGTPPPNIRADWARGRVVSTTCPR